MYVPHTRLDDKKRLVYFGVRMIQPQFLDPVFDVGDPGRVVLLVQGTQLGELALELSRLAVLIAGNRLQLSMERVAERKRREPHTVYVGHGGQGEVLGVQDVM